MLPDAGVRLLRWSLHASTLQQTVEALVQGFVDECQAVGLPIRRFNLTIRTVHPLFIAENWIWVHGQPELQVNRFTAAARASGDFRRSPMRAIVEGEARRLRYPIARQGPYEFPLFEQYAAAGMTEYLVAALSTEPSLPITVSVMTDAQEGFSDAHITVLEDAFLGLHAPIELYVHRSIARSVCSTYIGQHTGPRVLRGEIHRGSVESLRAVVWFCDLRNFTPMTLQLGSQGVVDVLNEFFGVVGACVEPCGGEILKFIGDAALAIFPIDGDEPAACLRALDAAQGTLRALAVRNAASPPDAPSLQASISLHVGEVSYGNIGAPARLDFTVIGAAVNLTSRLNGLGPRLGEPVVMSDAFAASAGCSLRPLGAHALKGIEGEVAVFGLPAGAIGLSDPA